MRSAAQASGSALLDAGESAPVPIYARDGSVKAHILVEAQDQEWALGFRWYLGHDGYAYRNLSHRTEGRGHIALHRELMGLKKGDGRQVDHVNLRKLDCRRSNLRVVEEDGHNKQNLPVRRGPKYSSSHRGVSLYTAAKVSKPWRARIYIKGREFALGYFATEEEAAEAAQKARAERMPFTTN